MSETMDEGAAGRAAPGAGEDTDASRLRALGYRQELRRSLGVLGNVSMGFAVVSPVVALYAVSMVGTMVAGPLWVWALPLVLVGQCLVVSVYGELTAQWPLAGGPYQWGRRLLGPSFGWLGGWVWQFAVMFGNTTVAYLAAPWVYALFGATPTPGGLVAVAVGILLVGLLVNAYGITLLRRFVSLGIAAEAVASVLVGIVLLLFFREHGFALFTRTLGAESLSGGSTVLGFLAAVAVAGWAFIGFDACVSTAEETKDAGRQVPRAMWWALLSVGAVVILNAMAVALAHPRPEDVVAGADVDPVTTAVVHAFGGWSDKPFVVVVLVGFLACAVASQGGSARGLYSLSRDGVFPFSRQVRRVNGRRAPLGGLAASTLISGGALALGLDATAIGALITFGTAATYLPFFLVSLAALIARLRGTWVPSGHIRLGRTGTVLNALAVLWTAFEMVNVCWPRAVLAPPGAPWYQVWAALLGTAVVLGSGVLYLLVKRPHERLRDPAAVGPAAPAESPTASPSSSA
ncbi:amino acid/polyamine/organocation transporter (APC superfamily) [Streptomyces sp. PanSC19]|uniref:APC family permease n=1 Tax=Streptomyces sp. PanSC19 TaxID=1520455 RepID=UPI000F496A97|nr:APC family permease [Streptomyces sp. PanSC19]ROQ35819.1 amino acid/polyamine/organocation transporter (APC superfamily) [Streptomyces sp. PanSC19]